MAKLRFVNTYFWMDGYIVELDPTEKLLFLYLLTNPLANIAGCFEITVRQIAFDTGISTVDVQRSLQKFEKDGKLIHRDGWLFLANFLKNQNLNKNMLKGVESIIAHAPAWAKQRVSKALKAFQTLREIEVEVEVEDERERGSKKEREKEVESKGKGRSPTTPLNPEFQPLPKDVDKLSAECPGVDLAKETVKFIDHYLGNGQKGADWNARWRKWIRNRHEWDQEGPKAKPKSGSTDMLSPDYVAPPFVLTFEIGMVSEPKPTTPERYEELKQQWRERHPDRADEEIAEYERGSDFRQRFGQTGQERDNPHPAPSRGYGNGIAETPMPVPR